MDREKENDQPVESDDSVEDVSGMNGYQGKEFIEPLKEVEDEPVETDIDQASGTGAENQSDIQATELDSPQAPRSESEKSSPESEQPWVESEETLNEKDILSEPEALADPLDENIEEAHDTQNNIDEEKNDSAAEVVSQKDDGSDFVDPEMESNAQISEPDPENSIDAGESEADISSETADLEVVNSDEDKSSDDQAPEADKDESKDSAPAAITGNEKRKNLSKLAISVVFILVLIGVVLTFRHKWSFRSAQEAPPSAVQVKDSIPIKSPGKITKPQKHDPYENYRNILNEVTQLRKTLLLKQQEVKGLKEHYGKAIKRLENDILQEMLSKKIQNYQEALQNTRIMLGLQTIQRRQAYIHKLDEPINWLEQGSEELLYLRRKALFDLQIIDIAGGIDMDKHIRHIYAGIQKYLLTADNLAIDPDAGNTQPLEQIWKRLLARTTNNPHLQAQLHSWYIQQEVCNGDLSRIGELSEISIDTAKCVSESNGSDIFLNNITVLSPPVAKYLCRWNGKWMCLNGLQTLSPVTAQYLFQWEGEWLSLNGLSEFPSDMAKHLAQWSGKQLELMGLKYDKNKTDRLALNYLADWEKAGGKLFVPGPIRDILEKL